MGKDGRPGETGEPVSTWSKWLKAQSILVQMCILEVIHCNFSPSVWFQGKQGEPGPPGNPGLRGLPVSSTQLTDLMGRLEVPAAVAD